MRYKTLVIRHLEAAEGKLNSVIIGLENNNISGPDTYEALKIVQAKCGGYCFPRNSA